MTKLTWTIFRQIEAIRESVAITLKDGAIYLKEGRDIIPNEDYFINKLDKEGLNLITPYLINYKKEDIFLKHIIEDVIEDKHKNYNRNRLETRASRYGGKDIGRDRSGVGWDNLPNFILSSGFIRLLGALEQFEIDLLKALLFYRAEGKSNINFNELITIDFDNIREENAIEYKKPAIWNWIKKPAENNIERRTIFKKIYDIDLTPDNFLDMKIKDIRKYYKEIYEKRNSIAHGRDNVLISFSDYCMTEVYIFKLIEKLRTECKEKYSIVI